MDSTLTLVDPALHGRKTLVFSSNSTLNAKIHTHPSGALVYTLKSSSVGDRTELLTPSGTVLASVYRRIIAPTGTLRGETRRLSKWFSGAKAFPAHFEVDGKTYQWRIDMVGQVACYESGAPSEAPLAWFTRFRRQVIEGILTTTPAHLSFAEGVAEVPDLMDTFVAFWLLVVDRANQRLQRLGVGGHDVCAG